MPPILNAQGLTKAFGATALFREISFTVSDGDRIGLIGPNGAGKSTLLKVLAGDEDADAGDVAVRKRARVGYVTQESNFAPGLTVRAVLEAALVRAKVAEGAVPHRTAIISLVRSCLLPQNRITDPIRPIFPAAPAQNIPDGPSMR